MKNRLNRNYFTPVFTASSLVILAACSGGGSSGNAVFDGGDDGNINDPDPADDGDDNTPDDEGVTRVGTAEIDTFIGGADDDILNGGSGADELSGGDGADIFILTLDTSLGRDRVTDFSVDDGDKLQIDTDDGDEDTLEALGLSVAQNGNNATVTNILFEDEVLFILDGVTHTDVTNANFGDYFDII